VDAWTIISRSPPIDDTNMSSVPKTIITCMNPTEHNMSKSQQFEWQIDTTMSGENHPLDIQLEVQDFRKTIDHLRGTYRIYLRLMKEIRKITTCN
jgi:hypothetical protein